VEDAVLALADVKELTPINDAAKLAADTFAAAKEELLPVLDAVLGGHDDDTVRAQREKLEKLTNCIPAEDLARQEMPGGRYISRDILAMSEGPRLPHHTMFKVQLMEQVSFGLHAGEVAKIARHTARYLEQRAKMKNTRTAKTDGKIFLGHGRSLEWKELKEYIRDRLNLDYDEFNREAVAGLTAKERLAHMLDDARFAFLVMTAEDQHADGTRHARENVIHEIGLFQGRLGFQKAIMLLEEVCEEFSNVHGVQQIRFTKGNLKACFDDIRHVLEREGIIK
jgi:predicted nucleotide-binding protein